MHLSGRSDRYERLPQRERRAALFASYQRSLLERARDALGALLRESGETVVNADTPPDTVDQMLRASPQFAKFIVPSGVGRTEAARCWWSCMMPIGSPIRLSSGTAGYQSQLGQVGETARCWVKRPGIVGGGEGSICSLTCLSPTFFRLFARDEGKGERGETAGRGVIFPRLVLAHRAVLQNDVRFKAFDGLPEERDQVCGSVRRRPVVCVGAPCRGHRCVIAPAAAAAGIRYVERGGGGARRSAGPAMDVRCRTGAKGPHSRLSNGHPLNRSPLPSLTSLLLLVGPTQIIADYIRHLQTGRKTAQYELRKRAERARAALSTGGSRPGSLYETSTHHSAAPVLWCIGL